MTKSNLKKCAVALVAVLCTGGLGSALAADDATGFYGGVGVGQTRAKINNNALHINGATATNFTKDETDIGYKIFGGYSFNKNLALEASYIDFGNINASLNMTAPAVGSISASIKANGVTCDLVGTLPLPNNFALFAKVGALYSTVKTDLTTSGVVFLLPGVSAHNKYSDTSLKLGMGARYDFNSLFALRGEWERYKNVHNTSTAKGDLNLYSAGLVFKF